MTHIMDKQLQQQKKSQTQMLLEYLQSGKKITKLKALTELGIMNMGARICEIRMFLGQDCIKTDIINGNNGKRYAEYSWNTEVV